MARVWPHGRPRPPRGQARGGAPALGQQVGRALAIGAGDVEVRGGFRVIGGPKSAVVDRKSVV